MDKLLAIGWAFEVSEILQAAGIEETLASAEMLESANFARTRRKPHQFTLKKNNASNGSKSNACHHYEGVWPHEATPYSARGKDC